MVVECSFGSINSKFRILQKLVETNEENAVHIEKAITLLHYIVRDHYPINEPEVVQFRDSYRNTPRTPRDDLQRRCNVTSRAAVQVRENFKLYFEHHPIHKM